MRNTGPQVYMKYYMKNCSPSIDNDQGGTRSALSPLLVRLPPTLASHIRELVAPIIDTFAREEDIQKERDGASKSSGFTSTAILLVLVGALATILSFSRSKLRASKAKYVEIMTIEEESPTRIPGDVQQTPSLNSHFSYMSFLSSAVQQS